jgi:hypothetical protein
VPRNKLCGNSTNFISFGPTDQKLWKFEIFRRSLGRANMCWSQPARIDHMYKKLRAGRRFYFFARDRFRTPGHGWAVIAGRQLAAALKVQHFDNL